MRHWASVPDRSAVTGFFDLVLVWHYVFRSVVLHFCSFLFYSFQLVSWRLCSSGRRSSKLGFLQATIVDFSLVLTDRGRDTRLSTGSFLDHVLVFSFDSSQANLVYLQTPDPKIGHTSTSIHLYFGFSEIQCTYMFLPDDYFTYILPCNFYIHLHFHVAFFYSVSKPVLHQLSKRKARSL